MISIKIFILALFDILLLRTFQIISDIIDPTFVLPDHIFRIMMNSALKIKNDVPLLIWKFFIS